MDKIKYIVLLLLSILFVNCTGSEDGVSEENRIKRYDFSDLEMYKGSYFGGYKVDISDGNPSMDLDSMRNKIMFKYLPSIAKDREGLASLRIEFSGDRLTYINKDQKKIISNYAFRDDSLFIYDTTGAEIFVALGKNKNDLYLHRGCMYTLVDDGKSPTVIDHKLKASLDTVLNYSIYNSINSMKSKEDIMIFCNVKYIIE